MQPLFRFIFTKGWIKLVVGEQSYIVFPFSPTSRATFSELWEALHAWVQSSVGHSMDKCQLPQDPELLDTQSEHCKNRTALKPSIQVIFILRTSFYQQGKSRVLPLGMSLECLTGYTAQCHKLGAHLPLFPSSVFSWCNYTFVWLQSIIYHKITGGPKQLECRSWKCIDHLL